MLINKFGSAFRCWAKEHWAELEGHLTRLNAPERPGVRVAAAHARRFRGIRRVNEEEEWS